MDDAAFDLALSHLKELYELCSSDNLSLTAVQILATRAALVDLILIRRRASI